MSESHRPPGAGLEAFDAIYEREFNYVWRTLGRFGVPPADLPDAVHDVFVIVVRRWADLEHDRSPRPWLFGIARRVAAGRRRKTGESLDPVSEPVSPVDDQTALHTPPADIWCAPIAGGAARMVSQGYGPVSGLVFDGGTVYFARPVIDGWNGVSGSELRTFPACH